MAGGGWWVGAATRNGTRAASASGSAGRAALATCRAGPDQAPHLDSVPQVKNKLAIQVMTVLMVACFLNTGWARASSVDAN